MCVDAYIHIYVAGNCAAPRGYIKGSDGERIVGKKRVEAKRWWGEAVGRGAMRLYVATVWNTRTVVSAVRPSVGCWVGWLVGRSVARSSSVGLSVGSACVHIALAPCNARGVGPRSRWSSLSDTRLLPASLSLSHRSRLGRSRARV